VSLVPMLLEMTVWGARNGTGTSVPRDLKMVFCR
jgi:hypothetical protein